MKELGIRREGKWGQQLVKERSTVAATMEALLDRAAKEILGALHASKIFGKGSKPVDFSRTPDPDQITRNHYQKTRQPRLVYHWLDYL